MRVSILAAALPVSLLGMSAAHADWTGKGEAGLVIATANTETDHQLGVRNQVA